MRLLAVVAMIAAPVCAHELTPQQLNLPQVQPASLQGDPRQTPASAQTFLAQILPMQSATLSWRGERGTWNGVWREFVIDMRENYFMTEDKVSRSVVTLSPLQIRSVSASGDCTTVIAVYPTSSKHSEPTQFRTIDIDGSPSGPFYVAWKSVSEVYRGQGSSSIELKGLSQPIQINLTSEQTATRVAFAMEFLRQNCDPTGGVW